MLTVFKITEYALATGLLVSFIKQQSTVCARVLIQLRTKWYVNQDILAMTISRRNNTTVKATFQNTIVAALNAIKNLNIWTIKLITVIVLKIEQFGFLNAIICLKDAD